LNVNWRWHGRFRGVLPLSPHALAEDGRLLFARPDELEARTYQVLQLEAGGAVTEQESLTVETVRQLALTVEAPTRLGVTDNDLYLFRDGRKSRFLPQRRVSYLSLALARGGETFAAAFTDMLFAGQTLCLADSGGKVVWTKDLDGPIGVVAVAPDGRAVAAGLEDGRLLAFNAARTLVWEVALEAPAVSLLLTGGESGRCIAVTSSGLALAIDGGEVVWRTELMAGGSAEPGELVLAAAARGSLTAVAGGDEAGGWVALLDGEGRPAWEHETGARVTGVALAPSGVHLALSQVDGELLLFEVEAGLLAAGAGLVAPAEELRRALAARDAGRPAEAREGLLRVLAADPGCLAACDALIELDDAVREAGIAAADRLAAEGQFGAALSALEAARAVTPADLAMPERWATVLQAAEARLAAAARQREEAGDLEAAVACWRELLRLDPKRRPACVEIARLNGLLSDRWEQAGDAAMAAGREEEAIAAWKQAQAIAPAEAREAQLRAAEVGRLVRAGIALYGQQRFAEAAFQFRKALALQPDHSEALRYLAYISGAGPHSPLSERFSRLE
jgi:tetratricopeptide (TPR) repeat protein